MRFDFWRWRLSYKLMLLWLINLFISISFVASMRQVGIEGWPVYVLGVTANAFSWFCGYRALIKGRHV